MENNHIFFIEYTLYIVGWAGVARPGRVAPIDGYIIILTLYSYINPLFVYISIYLNTYYNATGKTEN